MYMLDDKKISEMEKTYNKNLENIEALTVEQGQLNREVQEIRKPLDRITRQVLALQQISNLAGDQDRAGDLKLQRQRRDTIQKKFNDKINRLGVVEKELKRMRTENEEILRKIRIRRWILGEKELWNFRAKSMDKELTKKDQERLFEALKLVKPLRSALNKNFITARLDNNTFTRD